LSRGKQNLSENNLGPGGEATLLEEWLDLRRLTAYACVSERTLRGWIHSPVDPLPAVQVHGKILVRKSDFDRFLERHRIKPLVATDVDAIVREIQEGRGDGC
jgi:hypothetical protein